MGCAERSELRISLRSLKLDPARWFGAGSEPSSRAGFSSARLGLDLRLYVRPIIVPFVPVPRAGPRGRAVWHKRPPEHPRTRPRARAHGS